MITYKEVVALGWKDRWGKKPVKGVNTFRIVEENGQHLLSISFTPDEEGFYIAFIGWVDKEVKVNIWEHCDPSFNGVVKTSDDLKNIMRYCGVIEY